MVKTKKSKKGRNENGSPPIPSKWCGVRVQGVVCGSLRWVAMADGPRSDPVWNSIHMSPRAYVGGGMTEASLHGLDFEVALAERRPQLL